MSGGTGGGGSFWEGGRVWQIALVSGGIFAGGLGMLRALRRGPAK